MGALAGLLGVRRREARDGRSVFELETGPDHLNPYGVVHGGVIYALVDYAMGGALASRLGREERCATLEVKINYLAPVAPGALRAEARVIERTRRIGVLEGRVWGEGDTLVAVATGTFYITSSGS
jgi:acyl-CoA thioesterase